MIFNFQPAAILSVLLVVSLLASAFPSHSIPDFDSPDEDYPSDTHGGAEKVFSQLVSDESGEPIFKQHEEDADDSTLDETGELTKLNLEGFDDSDGDSESMETQYLIEELYGYTYDEAMVDSDVDDDD